MEKHYKRFEDVVLDILTKLEAKEINKYKANSLIQEELKYCTERDERLRKQRLEIDISAAIEWNKI